ncbi:hypothetical protein DSO57_1002241 [Entomophthora muscae]|uniref:Uncharacterized protein n=1 Tax=Entomophthora muscae TaxID=34485 RepID=A0ACC2SXQ9_9FUNG|nr:hypothetical protein DSO57_1002241 [Entomophthora muscae]
MSQTINKYVKSGTVKSKYEFTPEKIQSIIQRQKGREFSFFLKSEAMQEIVSICQSEWLKLALECLGDVEEELKAPIFKQMDEKFGRFERLNYSLR